MFRSILVLALFAAASAFAPAAAPAARSSGVVMQAEGMDRRAAFGAAVAALAAPAAALAAEPSDGVYYGKPNQKPDIEKVISCHMWDFFCLCVVLSLLRFDERMFGSYLRGARALTHLLVSPRRDRAFLSEPRREALAAVVERSLFCGDPRAPAGAVTRAHRVSLHPSRARVRRVTRRATAWATATAACARTHAPDVLYNDALSLSRTRSG